MFFVWILKRERAYFHSFCLWDMGLKGLPKTWYRLSSYHYQLSSSLLVGFQILFFNGKASDLGAVIGSTLFSGTSTASSKILVRQGLEWNPKCSSDFFFDLKSWVLFAISKSKSIGWGCGFTGGFLNKIGPLSSILRPSSHASNLYCCFFSSSLVSWFAELL